MIRYFQYGLIVLTAFAIGCKSYSKFTIDGSPSILIDTNLLGIWKADEDTDKANYVVIQNYYDVFHKILEKNKNLVEEDSRYSDYQKNKNFDYYFTYMNHHGQNPLYQQFYSFLSVIKNSRFLNVSYNYVPYENGKFIREKEEEGFFFVRIISVNSAHNEITIAVVADTSLKSITGSKELRSRIERNIDNPFFYSDTLHFHKVSSYHLSLNHTKKIANPNGYETIYEGNKFEMKPQDRMDTESYTDPITGESVTYVQDAPFFPTAMNGKHVYDINEENLAVQHIIPPNVPVEEKIIANLKATISNKFSEEGTVNLPVKEIVVDEDGKIVYSDFRGVRLLTPNNLLLGLGPDDPDVLFGNIREVTATYKGNKVVYKKRIFLNRYSVEIKNHVLTYRKL